MEKQMQACPKCKKITMPGWHDESKEAASMCQNESCKFVEEKKALTTDGVIAALKRIKQEEDKK